MANKNQKEILKKLGIQELNAMQEESKVAIESSNEVMVLSPTGTGKTLAFLLPIVSELKPEIKEVQALIVTPTRELAIQIEQVIRNMGSGFKANAVYGGRLMSKDKIELNTPPAILVGTPGRVLDHLERGTVATNYIYTLVLDEFDKSLEIGFLEEMEKILALISPTKKVLTSATNGVQVPPFVEFKHPLTVNFLDEWSTDLTIKAIVSPEKDKLETLQKALRHLGNVPGVVFLNFKDSIKRVSDYLTQEGISHGCFYGGLEQRERERALIKFRNGTHQLLLATDLAARGIDISEIKFIIHYHLPFRAEEFTHRNGRTARMHKAGSAFVLHWVDDELPDFIEELKLEEEVLSEGEDLRASDWATLFISGGRKDKISKGDIAGLFYKDGGLEKDGLGMIELKQDCAFVAVKRSSVNLLIDRFDNHRLKKKKVRVKEI